MILKYIDNSKKGSNEVSAESILKAAENYYIAAQLDGSLTSDTPFNLTNKDDMNKLGIKGRLPDSGQLMIYKNGEIYFEATYDGVEYIKHVNETKISKNNMVIGSSALWTTNGTGTITKYNNNEFAKGEEAMLRTYYFAISIMASVQYAIGDRTSTDGMDYSMSLKENFLKAEEAGEINLKILPKELNKEIDLMIELYDTDKQISEEEAKSIWEANKDKLPYAIDLAEKTNEFDVIEENIVTTSAYELVLKEMETDSTIIIPNYIKHEDGRLEKVTKIDSMTFRSGNDSDLGNLNCYLAPVAVTSSSAPTEKIVGKDLIISQGITQIGEVTFAACFLNSVVLPTSLTEIATGMFGFNSIDNLVLPKTITKIGESSFNGAGIKGALIIPKSVITIEDYAFTGNECDPTASDYSSCINMDVYNDIEELIFEEGSKIESIGDNAFEKNKLTTVTIPGSIKTIGDNAFNMSTLTSATIERAQGSDLSVDPAAFGLVTPIYQS